jgi:hypothetical protein
MVSTKFNPLLNPSLISLIAINKGFVPKNFKKLENIIVITQNVNLTWLTLAYLYPNTNFYIVLLDKTKQGEFEEKIKQLNLNNIFISMNKTPEFDYLFVDIPYNHLYKDEKNYIQSLLKDKSTANSVVYFVYKSNPGSYSEEVFRNFINQLCSNKDIEFLTDLLEIFLNRPTRFLLEHSELFRKLKYYLREKDKLAIKDKLKRIFLNDDFKVFSFIEINKLFTSFNYLFAGRLDFKLNDYEIAVFPSHVPTLLRFLSKGDIEKAETSVDFILNIGFREDIFIYKPEKNFEKAINFACENYFLIPRQSPKDLRRIVELPGGHRYALTTPIYDYFFNPTEEPRYLCEHPMLKGNEKAVWSAFYKTITTGEFFVCVENKLKPLEEIKNTIEGKIKLKPSINEIILKESVNNVESCYLVSEATKGAAIYLSPIEAVLLWFAYNKGVDKAVDASLNYLKEKQSKVNIENLTENNLQKIADALFKGRKAFNLQRLNIIDLI